MFSSYRAAVSLSTDGDKSVHIDCVCSLFKRRSLGVRKRVVVVNSVVRKKDFGDAKVVVYGGFGSFRYDVPSRPCQSG